MLSQTSNRVQAIKSKFENLSNDEELGLDKKKNKYTHASSRTQLCKQDVSSYVTETNLCYNNVVKEECNNILLSCSNNKPQNEEETLLKHSDDESILPNYSYLYSKPGIGLDKKKSLSRQSSDPGKKLHRSHAFRCDKSEKIQSPKRHGSCYGRPQTSEYNSSISKMAENEKPKLSKDRLKKLGCLLENQMRKENFELKPKKTSVEMTDVPLSSIPDNQVPKHILDQYAKVLKPRKKTESPIELKQDTMTDSGVSSDTENVDESEKNSRLKQIRDQFEAAIKCETNLQNLEKESNNEIKLKTNLELMKSDKLYSSSETMRLERKNPHIDLTDTLKKALKQPLPMGPPPKKPPRSYVSSPLTIEPDKSEQKRKDTKQMLDKLEKVLHERENKNPKNIYDVAEKNFCQTKRKEIHYLCTEILDITNRTLLPNQTNVVDSFSNCFNSLNCVVPNKSTLSLPYSRLSAGSNPNRNSLSNLCCSCSTDSLDKVNDDRKKFSTFFDQKTDENVCKICDGNTKKSDRGFTCHLNCKCNESRSEFFVKEHIYDVPNVDEAMTEVRSTIDCDKVVNDKHFVSKVVNGWNDLETSDGNTVQRVAEKDSGYGTVKPVKLNGVLSKSLEDISKSENTEEKIYDIPCCESSRSPSPDFHTSSPKSNFESLRMSFEHGFQKAEADSKSLEPRRQSREISRKLSNEKLCQRFVEKQLTISKSSDNLSDTPERQVETNCSKGAIRSGIYEKNARNTLGSKICLSIPRRERKDQLDVDRENLNRLMNEIYETVSAACRMDEPKPSRFPTDNSDGASSEDSVKLTRSLTEKRKNYLRRVPSRVAYLERKNVKSVRLRHQTTICSSKSDNLQENPYSTFRSWKSFRNSQQNLSKSQMEHKMADLLKQNGRRRDSTDSKFNLTDSKGNLLSMKDDFSDADDVTLDNLSLDDKAGCLDIELPYEPKKRALFDVCLLVGLNYMTGQAYVKSVFPNQVAVPPHIENLVFPETLSTNDASPKLQYDVEASRTQCYSLVLTNEKGERNFGYCRRVLPEGTGSCLPLCYCIIGRYRAPGFYYKVLQEIESHHGSSDVEIHTILQQLLETDFPNPGEEIQMRYPKRHELCKNTFRNSVNLGDVLKAKTLPDRRSGSSELLLPQFYDLENNNGPQKLVLSVEMPEFNVLKRSIEPRIDEDNLSTLLDCLGPSLLVKVFGSLLLERKIVFVSDNLSQLSSCMEALQSILYPFVWQQPLISTIPSELRKDILEAPLPILAGMLRSQSEEWEGLSFEEGMLINLDSTSKVIFSQGDETTILPTVSNKTLKATLQMESSRTAQKEKEEERTRNVMISEAFLRFFVDIIYDFWSYFTIRELKDGEFGKGDVVFEKENYLKSAPTKQIQYFLEWFTETAMFNHFIQNMAVCYKARQKMAPRPVDYSTIDGLVDAPLPNFYELFDERLTRKNSARKTLKSENKNENSTKNNYKSALNKRVKILKTKLKELVN